MEPLTPGDPVAVGPFALSGRLGAGGMGTVYLGQDVDGQRVAVKVIHPQLAADREFRARFGREIALARSVDEPWAARVVAADPESVRPWLATEYVEGPDLERQIAATGRLPPAAVARLGSILAGALADLHARGIVHRDLKPANVLLTADGARLIDFGIARAVDTTRITHTGMLIGTPAYMSPEQADGHEPGAASDVFSLGSVLVFAATGTGPFGTTSNPVAMLVRISRDEPDLSGVPEPLLLVVADCLKRNAAARPAAAELARRFAAAVTAGPAVTLVGPPDEPRRMRVPSTLRPRTARTPIMVVITVLVLAAAGFGLSRTNAFGGDWAITSIPVVPNDGNPQLPNLAALALAPKGYQAAVRGPSEVAIVNIDTKTLRRFPGVSIEAPRILGWSADGTAIYTADIEGKMGVRRIDAWTGQVGAPIEGTNGTELAAISKDGRTGWFARPGFLRPPGGQDEGTFSIKQVDLVENGVIATVALPFHVKDIVLDPDGSSLYVGGPDNGTEIRTTTGLEQRAMPFALTHYERLLTASSDRSVALGWRTPGVPVLAILDSFNRKSTINVPDDIDTDRQPTLGALAPGGKHVFLPCRAGGCGRTTGFAVGVVELATGRQVDVLTPAAELTDFAVTPDGKRLVGTDVEGNVVVFDVGAYTT